MLYVRDVERAVVFYRDVLGLEPVHPDWKTMGAAFLRAKGSARAATSTWVSGASGMRTIVAASLRGRGGSAQTRPKKFGGIQ